jgi:hypothetical protein
MPPVTAARIIRLALDINVFVADVLSFRLGRRNGAATMIVDAVRDGACPAGPVQLITSLPMIETYASVLRRRLDYAAAEADEKAWLLEQYALDGPMPDHPHVTVGCGYIPFETEEQLRQSIENHRSDAEAGKLFHEIQDDRYVLETALAGSANILVTADVDDFARGAAVRFTRKDVLLFPFADRRLVIATPGFAAFWLRQGVVPDAEFVDAHPDEFVPRPGAAGAG